MEEGEALLFAGVVLLVAGLFFYLAYSPTYTSLSSRLGGYETPDLTKSDYGYYLMLDKFVMPLLSGAIALSLALLLSGVFLLIAKKK